MRKKLSLLLVFAMVLSLLPVSVFAETLPEQVDVTATAEGEHASVTVKVENVETYKLNKDTILKNTPLKITADGYTVTGVTSVKIGEQSSTLTSSDYSFSNDTLTFSNESTKATDKITITVTLGEIATTLSGLTVTPDGGEAATFNSETKEYNVAVGNTVESVTVVGTPTVTTEGAVTVTVSSGNQTAQDGKVDLAVGENVVKVTVAN